MKYVLCGRQYHGSKYVLKIIISTPCEVVSLFLGVGGPWWSDSSCVFFVLPRSLSSFPQEHQQNARNAGQARVRAEARIRHVSVMHLPPLLAIMRLLVERPRVGLMLNLTKNEACTYPRSETGAATWCVHDRLDNVGPMHACIWSSARPRERKLTGELQSISLQGRMINEHCLLRLFWFYYYRSRAHRQVPPSLSLSLQPLPAML